MAYACLQDLYLTMSGKHVLLIPTISSFQGILPRLQLCGCKAIERDLVVRRGEVGQNKTLRVNT